MSVSEQLIHAVENAMKGLPPCLESMKAEEAVAMLCAAYRDQVKASLRLEDTIHNLRK